MTVISAPRMTPRSVSSLIALRVALASVAILVSLEIHARARRRRCRVAADDLPTIVILYPHVRQNHAVLDNASEIFYPPARLDVANHHAFELACALDFDVDCIDISALNCVEPFI